MSVASARDRVYATCVELADLGYLAGTGGNVAVRVDAERFAVTPSAVDYYAMRRADIAVVRLSDGAQLEGTMPASVESGLHAAVLRARPEAVASIHTHQPVASAFTLLGRALVVRDETRRLELGEGVPRVGYAPSGTAWLATRVGAAFTAGNHACLMQNHGVVCIGSDVDEAKRRVASLEAECAEQLVESLSEGLPAAARAPVLALLEASLMAAEARA
jgi:L-fuculose-phosphate aldolase